MSKKFKRYHMECILDEVSKLQIPQEPRTSVKTSSEKQNKIARNILMIHLSKSTTVYFPLQTSLTFTQRSMRKNTHIYNQMKLWSVQTSDTHAYSSKFWKITCKWLFSIQCPTTQEPIFFYKRWYRLQRQ